MEEQAEEETTVELAEEKTIEEMAIKVLMEPVEWDALTELEG